MVSPIYQTSVPVTWSNTAKYKPNVYNYPIVIYPQVIYNGKVYYYKGISTVGTIPSSDSQAVLNYSNS